jgi:hypothetical protein
MASDANLQLKASSLVSSAASTGTLGFSATGVQVVTPRRGLKARVVYSGASNNSGVNTLQFGLSVSYDGGSTWNVDQFIAPVITVGPAFSTAALSLAGEVFIPFDISPTTLGTNTQVQVTTRFAAGSANFSNAGVTTVVDVIQTRPD